MKRLILVKIQEKLSESNKLKSVDENTNQLDVSRPHVAFPCALIDLDSADFDYGSRKHTIGTSKINIHVAKIKLSASSRNATASQKEKAWEIYDLIDHVKGLLHDWCPIESKSGAMILKNIRSVKNSNGVQEKIMGFELVYDAT